MDIGNTLIDYLKSKPAITDLIGSNGAARIWLDEARQGAQLPYIVIGVFEGPSEQHLNGVSGISTNRCQVDCFAANSKGAFDLAEAVRFAPLQAYRGQIPGGFVNNVNADSSYRRGKETSEKGNKQKRFFAQADYLITYTHRKV